MNRTILLMALAACGGAAEPQFLVSETPACEHDVRVYDRGLFAYLAADTDGDGAFELSFDEGLVRSVSGSYNLATGAFGYNETFEEGHYRVSREVYGQGVVWTDGDVDLSYQVIDTFTNEGQLGNVVRERRIGCDVERYYSDFEDNVVLVESGVVGGERYSYVRRQYDDGRVLETTGTLSPEGEWNEELAYTLDEVLYVHEERGRANGVVTRSFSHTDGTWVSQGVAELKKDGTRTYEVAVQEEGQQVDWAYSVDMDGDGSGTTTTNNGFADQECDLSFSNFSCSTDCAEECPRRRGGWSNEPPRGPLGHR